MPRSETLRMIFGFSLLAILAGLALAIAMGKVEEATSYGLMPLMVAISSLSTQFATWAFSDIRRDSDDDSKSS